MKRDVSKEGFCGSKHKIIEGEDEKAGFSTVNILV
jgi:hypothetical protein